MGIPREETLFIVQDVGRALSVELCDGDDEDVGPTAETVGGEQDVTVTSLRDWKRVEIVGANGGAGTFRQRHGDDRRSNSRSWGFPRLALEQCRTHYQVRTRSYLSTRKNAPACSACARSKVARDSRTTSLNYPRAHGQWHVNANRLVVQQPSCSPHRVRRVKRRRRRRVTEE